MNISGLGGAALQAPTAVSAPTRPSAADDAKARAAASAAQDEALLAEVRKKGLVAWAKEQKLEALKAKIRQDVLAARGTSEAALAKLDPKARGEAESSIEQEIAKRIQAAMKDLADTQKTAQGGKPAAPMIIDISV